MFETKRSCPFFPKVSHVHFVCDHFEWYLFLVYFFFLSSIRLSDFNTCRKENEFPEFRNEFFYLWPVNATRRRIANFFFFLRFWHCLWDSRIVLALKLNFCRGFLGSCPAQNKINNHFQLQFTRCHLSPVIDCCSRIEQDKLRSIAFRTLTDPVYSACAGMNCKNVEKWLEENLF